MILEAFWVALSTYSIVPVPQFEWNERSMRYAICFFPAVGLLCGGALWAWTALCRWLNVGALLFAVMAACLPLAVSGGIHMDGFMDTVDALSSHRPREKKLEILKDSRCGAFAVLYCAVYLLLSAGLYGELYLKGQILALCPVFVLSRALSALCAVTMPNARGSGMLCAFTEHAQKRGAVLAVSAAALAACAGMAALAPFPGGGAALAALLTVPCYRAMAKKQFGGATGDTAGFFLQACELAALAGAWLGGLAG